MRTHVLVVEDSATQRAQLAADLEQAGFALTLAKDGQEALERLAVIDRRVDVVLTDVNMPRIDGLDLCRRIKSDATLPDLPVVLLTSLQDPLDIVRGLEAGADNFLTKPYEVAHLVDRVQAICAGRVEADGDGGGAQLDLLGQRFVVTAERQQILELLVGAFEDLVHANHRLRERERQLAEAQADLADQLARSEQERARLGAVLEAIPDGVVIADADGCVTDINAAALSLGLGTRPELTRGLHVTDLPVTATTTEGREVPPPAWPLVQAYEHGRSTTSGVEFVLRSDHRDDAVPVTITAAPVHPGSDDGCEAVAVIRDVSAWAFHDRLTALPNRSLFADRIARALLRSADDGSQIAVLKLELDRFTVVHDSLGRGAEDSLIIAVARRLVGTVRADATVARLGGDRFGILLEGLRDLSEALAVADRVVSVLERAVTLGHEEVSLTASIGIAPGTGPDDAETLLRQASTALHRAAQRGGGSREIYDESLDAEARRQLFLYGALRRALAQQEFVVHFQPVVSLGTGEVVETEALVRWEHPDDGLIPPGEFIPLAEESGLIVPLGRWVLNEACTQTQVWRERLGRELGVSVNLSARQFEDPELQHDVERALADSGLPATALTLEVTESALMREPRQAAATLQALRELGVRIAVDDFGTGYSSLSYLRSFPLDVLKVDRSFVRDLGADADATAIVQAIIALASSLDLALIAEGVEEAEQLVWLREAGCHLAAGYHLARPAAPADVELLLDVRLGQERPV